MLSSLYRVRCPLRTLKLVRSLSTAKAQGESDSNPIIQLYQYAICPFCNKTKAVLDYADISYEAVEVNPLTKAEIKWSTDYRKVPIARQGNQIWRGSDDIAEGILSLDAVQSNLAAKWQGTDMTMTNFRNAETDSWVSFTNDKLAALLYPNICSSYSDSYAAFGYVRDVGSFSWVQKQSIRAIGAMAMYMAASKVKST